MAWLSSILTSSACAAGPERGIRVVRDRQRGLTLVEMAVTVAIVGILGGLAYPPFDSLVRDTRLRGATNDLLTAIFLTRSEAIKRSRRVTLCTSHDKAVCGANIGWHSGWIVFEDSNGNGLREAAEPLISAHEGLWRATTIVGNRPVRNYISYVSTGTSRTVNGALLMGAITVCQDGTGRQIVISATGRPRVVERVSC